MPIPRKAKNYVSIAALALLVSSALTACGGGNQATSATVTVTHTKFDPSNFGRPGTTANPYFPLVPGTQWVREGFTDVGKRRVPHQVTTTVSDVYREIAGVQTVAVFDFEIDGGQVTQTSIDYLAVDKFGNLWDVGGYTEEYQGGRYVSALDPWLNGVNGATAGILIQGNPRVGTPLYAVASPGVDEGDVAEVVQRGGSHCVPFLCFHHILITREGKASAPNNELKYYARGVGQIDNVPQGASVHQDIERLINATMLSPKGLAEISAEVLRMDHHAVRTAPGIFAKQPLGRRVQKWH